MSKQFSENIKTNSSLNDMISGDENKNEEELSGKFGNSFKNKFPFKKRINKNNEDEDFKIDENFYYYKKDALDLNSEKSLIGMKETNSETKKGLLVMEKSPLTIEKSLSIMEKVQVNESHKDQNSHLNEKSFNELNSIEDKFANLKFTSKKRGRQGQSCSNIVNVNLVKPGIFYPQDALILYSS